ncbi:hypothetical protein [Rheinheimera gaetbuli]
MINVTYSITFDYIKFYTEFEIANASQALLEEIAKKTSIDGCIKINGSDDTQVVSIVDELIPWIQNLCLRAIPDLSCDVPVSVNYFSRSGTLEIKPIGEQLKITGNLTGTATFPKVELLKALFFCGQRFIKTMREIKGNDAGYIANIEYVMRFVGPAKVSIENL